MAQIIPEGFGTCTWVMTVPGDPDPYTCGFGFHAISSSAAETATDDFYDAWADNILVGQANFVTLARTDVLYNDGDPDNLLVFTHDGSATGSGTGGYLPQNNAMLIRKVSGLAGRKNRGRIYVPYAASEDATDNYGNIGGAALSDQQGRADAFLSDATSLTPVYGLVILHSAAGDPTDLTNLSVQGRIATQRRRLR